MAGNLSAGNSMSTTLPSTWVTVPFVRTGAIVAIWVFSLGMRLGQRARASDNLKNLVRDGGLARLVVGEREVGEEVVGVVGRVAHGDHLRGVEAGDGFEQRLIDQRLE